MNIVKKTIGLLLSATLFVSVLAFGNSGATGDTHVVILATSDMHGNVWGYAYEDDKETVNNGMSRLYTYISQVRKDNPTVFLVDGGDDIQGSIMTDDIANKSPDNEHPVISAMNYMDYDAMTIGNHEFNWGIPVMKKILSQANFPVLGANILDKNGEYVTGSGYTIVTKNGIRLAIIGVCTPFVPRWDAVKEGITETSFEPANIAVKKAIEEIGDKADIIMVSAHMGQFAEFDEENGSDSGEKIVEDNPEVDILQVAHMHITVNDRIDNIPVVGVKNLGREIARIDILLDKDRNIKEISTSIIDMEAYKPSEEIRQIPIVKDIHAKALKLIRSGEGEEQEPGERLGVASAKFQPENEIRGLPEGLLRETAVVDLVNEIQLAASGADVSATAMFKDTSDLPEGDLYYKNIFDIYKYDNTLYAMNITGRDLKKYMEWSASFFNTWKPGDINISFNPDVPSYRYDMFAGIDYEINLSKPAGERIENIMFKGTPLKDDQVLKLAVNNYRYSSTIKAEHISENKHYWESSGSIRDQIVDYISKNSPISPAITENWKITGVNLSTDDPRRTEIISYINEGYLESPYNESYNLADYNKLIETAKANKAAGIKFESSHEH